MRFLSALIITLSLSTGLEAQVAQRDNPQSNLTGGPLVMVSDEAQLAKTSIAANATDLLKAHNYRRLDTLSDELRSDGRTFSNGEWPIKFFFSGLCDLDETATNQEWENRLQLLRDWFDQDADSISARIAMARSLYNYGWKARGSGWASTVTAEGWRLLEERSIEARRIFSAAESIRHHCPIFFSTRLKIALTDGTPREVYDELFKQALEAFPNYSPFYMVRALYLLPRWHGKPGEWERFALESADHVGGEDGDILYAQIIWNMHDTRIYGNILKEAAVEWPRAQRGFEALCRRYPNSTAAISEYCSISGFAPTGARQLMRSLFERVGNRVDLSVWETKEKYLRDRAWAFSNQ